MNWEQVRAIVWLRWRLSCNRFARAGILNAIIAILMLAFLVAGAVASGAAGLLLGGLVLAKQSAQVLLAIWDGVMVVFLVFWLVGVVAEIQRAESIDISKLLHLPLTIRQVFVFNYLASHFTLPLVLFLPGMLGLSLGLALTAGLRMILLVPLVLVFVFLLSSWTYCLRGWLSALMVNKRRRRAIVVWITVGFVLLFQLPGLLINKFVVHKQGPRNSQEGAASSTTEPRGRDESFALSEKVIRAHLAIPAGWPGYGAMTLMQHNYWPWFGSACAGCLLGTAGLLRSYRATLRFYQGAETGTAAPVGTFVKKETRPRGIPLMERSLPWLSDETAALTLATLRSLLRAPELKMSLIMPIVAGAALGSIHLTRLRHGPAGPLTGFAPTAAALLTVFSFAPVMANAFGLDRNGFRGLVLLPMRRADILLAKNLAFLPLIAAVGVALLTLAELMLGFPWEAFVTGLLQVLIAFILFSLMCNLLSILTPYRTAAGTLQAKKPKPVVFLAIGVTMLGMPIVLSPTLIPPVLQLVCSFLSGVPAWLPINVLAGVAVLAAVAWLYWLVLPAQGRLLYRREQRILCEVTEELE